MQAVSASIDRSFSIPKLADFRSSTDHKVHRAAVSSNVLSNLGIALALASAIGTYFVSLYCSLGIAAGVALYAASKFISSPAAPSKAHQAHAEKPRYIQGQHPGIENASMNCWMNAILQFSLHVPPLRDHLKRSGPKVVREAMDSYERAKSRKDPVATGVDSQRIREWMAGRVADISDSADVQEDVQEPLRHLMQGLLPMTLSINRASGVRHPDEHWNMLTIPLVHFRKKTFEETVRRNFLTMDDNHGGGTRRFRNCPNDLFFHLSRFRYGLLGGSKIDDHVPMKSTFKIADDWTTSGHGAKYRCRAFIEHIGDSLESGHYICYARYNDGWWCFDDETVTKVSREEAESKIGDSYISYFSRE